MELHAQSYIGRVEVNTVMRQVNVNTGWSAFYQHFSLSRLLKGSYVISTGNRFPRHTITTYPQGKREMGMPSRTWCREKGRWHNKDNR